MTIPHLVIANIIFAIEFLHLFSFIYPTANAISSTILSHNLFKLWEISYNELLIYLMNQEPNQFD